MGVEEKSMHRTNTFVALGFTAALALAGCASTDQQAIIYGQLVDALTGGVPTAGGQAGVVSIGDQSMETNESGFFLFKVARGGEVLIRTEIPGYASTVRPVTAPDKGSLFVSISLLPFGASTSFDAATGGTVNLDGATVTFGPNALDATGTVTASLALLDPSNPAQLEAFPGGFRTDADELLESFGAIAIEVRDSSDNLVGLKSGQTAAAELPVVGAADAEIPMWSFDETLGRWHQAGTFTGCSGGHCQGELPHLSWWNADKVMETACVVACATDSAGTPADNILLEAQGVDYHGASYATTGPDGCACLNVRMSSQVQIAGVTSGGMVLSAVVSTPATQGTCGAGSCTNLQETLVVASPRFQAVLTWGAAPNDLDSHFTGPCAAGDTGCTDGRFHVYYSSRGSLAASPWAYLDTDDTSSFGPEITTLARCETGVYRFSVYNYSGSPGMETSLAVVRVMLPNGRIEEYSIPGGNPDAARIWVVGDLRCDTSCNCSWTAVNAYRGDDSSAYNP
jgi:hypothetical protein